jgi:hypothetical protein
MGAEIILGSNKIYEQRVRKHRKCKNVIITNMKNGKQGHINLREISVKKEPNLTNLNNSSTKPMKILQNHSTESK